MKAKKRMTESINTGSTFDSFLDKRRYLWRLSVCLPGKLSEAMRKTKKIVIHVVDAKRIEIRPF